MVVASWQCTQFLLPLLFILFCRHLSSFMNYPFYTIQYHITPLPGLPHILLGAKYSHPPKKYIRASKRDKPFDVCFAFYPFKIFYRCTQLPIGVWRRKRPAAKKQRKMCKLTQSVSSPNIIHQLWPSQKL